MIRALVVVIGVLALSGYAHAACPSGSGKCNGTLFCDANCTGSGCPGSASDTCPGHCLHNPEIECDANGDCPGSPEENPCSFSTTTFFGHCTNYPEIACIFPGDCPDSDCGDLDTPYGGDGSVVICGTSGADTMTGTSGNDVLCGEGGNDTIDANAGDDLIFGGNGDDLIYADNGTDTVYGGNGNDEIYAGDPSAFSLGGNDFVDGGDGDDYIVGTHRISVFGGPYVQGDNVLLGGPGNDEIIGLTGRDVIKGGDGDDDLKNNEVSANNVPDDVVGSLLCGGNGNDELQGVGPSHQCLDGGAGTDTCTYAYAAISGTQDAVDLGTAKDCELNFTTTTRAPSCGCEG
jgi:hypothetical protein